MICDHSPLCLKVLRPGGDTFELLEDFRLILLDEETGLREWTAPKGFITNVTSSPWWARWYVGQFGPWAFGAVIHDWLYEQRAKRRDADKVLRDILVACGVGPVKRWIMYKAVRKGGHDEWKDND